MSAISPGPWVFIEKPERGRQWEIRSADGYQVVSFPGPESGEPDLDAVDRANAPLIAAAPEMRAVLSDPIWAAIWRLLNGFASGKTQASFGRAEPLAILGELYQALAIIDVARRKTLAKSEGRKNG